MGTGDNVLRQLKELSDLQNASLLESRVLSLENTVNDLVGLIEDLRLEVSELRLEVNRDRLEIKEKIER